MPDCDAKTEPSMMLIVGQAVVLVLLSLLAVVNFQGGQESRRQLDDRQQWMHNLREYTEERSVDRATRTAVQEALDKLCDENDMNRVIIKSYKPIYSFPEPPK